MGPRMALPEAYVKGRSTGERDDEELPAMEVHVLPVRSSIKYFLRTYYMPAPCCLGWRSSNEQDRKGPCCHEVHALAGETDDDNGKVQIRGGPPGIGAAREQGKGGRQDPSMKGCVRACSAEGTARVRG